MSLHQVPVPLQLDAGDGTGRGGVYRPDGDRLRARRPPPGPGRRGLPWPVLPEGRGSAGGLETWTASPRALRQPLLAGSPAQGP